MATTFTGEKETAVQTEAVIDVTSTRRRGGRGRGGNGRGPGGGGGPGGPGGGEEPRRFSADRYRIGVLVGIASILMMFTALASALIVRSGLHSGPADWRGGQMPTFVYVSTGLLVLSSLTFMRAKSSLKHSEEAG